MADLDMAEASSTQSSPSPVVYTAEEVAQNFESQLACLDFKRDLMEFGIGSLSLFKRRKALQQLTALSISLWKLTLERSFPQDAEVFFQHFLENNPRVTGTAKKAEELRALVQTYVDLLAEKRDADFSIAAQHMADALSLSGADNRSFCLKISLRIRQLYNFIFAKLI